MARIQAAIRGVRALLIGVVVMAALGAFALYDRGRMGSEQAAARECLAVAPAAAAALFSYDYRTFDASVASGRSFATGSFADEYAQTTAALKAAATKEQAVVTAQAESVGIVSSNAVGRWRCSSTSTSTGETSTSPERRSTRTGWCSP